MLEDDIRLVAGLGVAVVLRQNRCLPPKVYIYIYLLVHM